MLIKEFNYPKIKAPGIDERYLTQVQIDQITSRFSDSWKQNTLGYSVEKRPVHSWTWGHGPQNCLCGLKCTETKRPQHEVFWI